jgi:hypothetical protein
MKSITIASSNKSLFGLAIDNTKAADSNYPKGYYECIGSRRRDQWRCSKWDENQADFLRRCSNQFAERSETLPTRSGVPAQAGKRGFGAGNGSPGAISTPNNSQHHNFDVPARPNIVS